MPLRKFKEASPEKLIACEGSGLAIIREEGAPPAFREEQVQRKRRLLAGELQGMTEAPEGGRAGGINQESSPNARLGGIIWLS